MTELLIEITDIMCAERSRFNFPAQTYPEITKVIMLPGLYLVYVNFLLQMYD